MANEIATPPPINPVINVQPLTVAEPGRDAGSVPAQIANLPGGTTVEGFVINRDGQNNPILRTPVGDVLIKSDIFLKTGSEVIFRIDTTASSRARMVSIDGMSPADYAAQQARMPQEDSVAQPTMPNAQAEANAADTAAGKGAAAGPISLRAVLLAGVPQLSSNGISNASESPLPAILTRLQTGAMLKLTVLKADLPLPGAQAPSAQPLSQQAAQQLTAAQQRIQEAPALQQRIPEEPALQQRVLAQPVMSSPLSAPAAKPLAAPAIAPSMPVVTEEETALLPAHPPTISSTPAPAASGSQEPRATQPTSPQPQATSIQSLKPPPAILLEQAIVPALTLAPEMAEVTMLRTAAMQSKLPTAMQPNLSTAMENIAAPRVPTVVASTPTFSASAPPPISGSTTATTAPSQRPQGMPAVIIGHEADGAAILHTPIGTVKTYTPRPMPVGTKLAVDIQPEKSPIAPVATTLDDTMENITSLARDWKTPSTLLQTLQNTDPRLAQAFLQQMPVADARLTSGLLFFLAAVKNADPRQWLGNRLMSQLEEKIPSLTGQLRGDMEQFQQLFAEAPKGSWSTVMLPIFYDQQLEQARFFYRQDEEKKEGGGKGGSNHRFILEVDLSHIGDMQFDGFVRGAAKRQFDLVVRSARMLTPEITNEIRQIFDNAMQTTGYGGFLSFQQGSQHFVRPLAGMKESSSPSGSANTILA